MKKLIELVLFTSSLSSFLCMAILIRDNFPMTGVLVGFIGIILILGLSEVSARNIDN